MARMILFFFKLDIALHLAIYRYFIFWPFVICRYYKEVGLGIKAFDEEEAAIDRIWCD